MNCINNKIIQRYIDGEIRLDEKVRIENHLKVCTHCAERLQQLQNRADRIKNLLVSLADKEVVRPPLPSTVDLTVPVFESEDNLYEDGSESAFSWKKRLIYGLCGACAVVALIAFPLRNIFEKPQELIYMQNTIQEIDANRPYSEQETVITVIDPEGNVLYID